MVETLGPFRQNYTHVWYLYHNIAVLPIPANFPKKFTNVTFPESHTKKPSKPGKKIAKPLFCPKNMVLYSRANRDTIAEKQSIFSRNNKIFGEIGKESKQMDLLKQRILKDGKIKEGNILKVDSFLNHQMDIQLLQEIGKEFRRLFPDKAINKILTIEASGIGIAAIVAQYFDNAKVVFAKKTQSKNLDGELYTAPVVSFTRGTKFDVQVSTKFLGKEDCVLVIDDFLARGQALQGLLKIVEQSGAKLAGCGIVIEKGFQEGGEQLRQAGINLHSLAIIDSIENGVITFRNED